MKTEKEETARSETQNLGFKNPSIVKGVQKSHPPTLQKTKQTEKYSVMSEMTNITVGSKRSELRMTFKPL